MVKIPTPMARVHPTTHITRNERSKSITYNESCDNRSSPEPHK